MIVFLLLLTPSASSSALPLENSTTSIVGELLSESCIDNYDGLSCLKVLATGLVPTLAIPRRLNIWPGISVVTGGFEVGDIPSSKVVDGYLVQALRSFLNSFSVQIRVLDQDGLEKFGRTMDYAGEEGRTARRRRVSNAILLAGLLSAGTIIALGIAAVSAMAGKALALSLVNSGMMMVMNRNPGNVGAPANGVASTYEIIHTNPREDVAQRHRLHPAEEYQIIKAH